jgi:hypothetical protein
MELCAINSSLRILAALAQMQTRAEQQRTGVISLHKRRYVLV